MTGEKDSTLLDIQRARRFLARAFEATPVKLAETLSSESGGNVYLKLENVLPTGSFKVRGALWAVSERLSRESTTEVVAASTGNHGAAVAYAAGLSGVKATIFLPMNSNPVKRDKIASLGANIIEKGNDVSASSEAAEEYASRSGAYLLRDSTDPSIPTGTATIGCELLEQVPQLNAIYVPVGDSALIRGIAAGAKMLNRSVRVVGVQAAQAPSYYLSWKNGAPVTTATCRTIADGLATREPIEGNVRILRSIVDEMILVSEDEMLEAMRWLKHKEEVIAEPAGAAATAAFLKDDAGRRHKDVALIVSGGNVSPEIASRLDSP